AGRAGGMLLGCPARSARRSLAQRHEEGNRGGRAGLDEEFPSSGSEDHMNEIRHIVFDIGRVLIHYDPDLPFRRLIPDAAERKWCFDNACTSDWNIEQDRGRAWDAAEAELLALHPGHAKNIRNFRRHWHEMVPHAYDDSVTLMERLI